MKRAAALLIMILISFSTLYAQEQYTGFMGDDVPDAVYPVKLEVGHIITVTAAATSGNLDTYIALQDPDGVLVIENDDQDSTTLDSAFTFTVERGGEYNVILSNIRTTSGDYTLTIDVSKRETPPEGAGGEQVHTGYMGDDVADDLYPIQLTAGQTITVTAEATSDNLDTYIGLQDPDGELVIENDDRDSNTLDSAFMYIVQQDGEYNVVVSNIRNTSGGYILTIRTAIETTTDEAIILGEVPENSTIYTGFMSDDVPEDEYAIVLGEGEALRAVAEKTSGNLDTYLSLYDSNGTKVAENDDADSDTLNSELIYIPELPGEYTLIMSNFPQSTGDYRLFVEIMPQSEAQLIVRAELSGPVLHYDTEHFRVHYTLEGTDATTEAYAQAVGDTMEEVWEIQVNQLGWPAPLADGVLGGDNRFDVYLEDILGDEDSGLGFTYPDTPSGDNPATEVIEDGATPSYVVLDNDYRSDQLSNPDTDPIAMMRATAAHEFHHAIQFTYDAVESVHWYYEATAVWMETITFPEAQAATPYVATLYSYPEICFGADGPADPTEGTMMYGEWLFIQSLVDRHGEKLPFRLWDSIALYEGMQAIERTLETFDDNLVDAVRSYRFQNLMRDYTFAPHFEDAAVWMENHIDRTGQWTYTGEGIQELAANYFEFGLGSGTYNITIDQPDMELWAVGVKGTEAAVTPLGTNGNFNAGAFTYAYLMVFNPNYDEDITQCEYRSYVLDITRTEAAANAPTFTLNASNFIALE